MVTAQTPGQADEIPESFARWLSTRMVNSQTGYRWEHLTAAEREFWRSLDAAQVAARHAAEAGLPADAAALVAQAVPELSAVISQRDYAERELNKLIDEVAALRERYRLLLDKFFRSATGYDVRLSGVSLMGEYRNAGLPVPERLSHLERHASEGAGEPH